MPIITRSAALEDVEVIRHLACLTWPNAYSSILSSRQLGYMLNLFYSSKQLAQQIKEGDHFYLAIDNEQPVGFVHFSSYDHKVPEAPNTSVWKLHKIYVLPAWQSRGVGKLLFDLINKEIKANAGNYLVLNVNRENPAFDYYQKKGFTVLETGDFDIGEGFYMNDFIMGKSLP